MDGQGCGGLFEVFWEKRIRTGTEGREAVFMVQRGQNSYARFEKLIEYGNGLGKYILVILEGQKGSGWAGFVRKIIEMVGSPSSVSADNTKSCLTMVLLLRFQR